jgi:8-oxo-dGTP diphosphatase
VVAEAAVAVAGKSEPPEAGRVVVIKDDKLLLMRRSKPDGNKYTVIPGGRLEQDERPDDAAVREVTEETTVVVGNPRLVFIEEPLNDRWGRQYIYLCDYVSGEPMLSTSSEEYEFQAMGNGTYEPFWADFSELNNEEYPFRSPGLGRALRDALQNGFPSKPLHW